MITNNEREPYQRFQLTAMRGKVTGDTHVWFVTYSPSTDNFLLCNKVHFLCNSLLPSLWQTEKVYSHWMAA